ncbi:MAG: HD-GYP domain-containing protein [Chloroflexi bacterium]|nr:HD-GYP domain-containing protein [Chloroflexota bacterium]
MISLGVFGAILWNYNPLSIPLLALPVIGLRYSYQLAHQLERQTKEALVALMRVIDERDEHTSDHSRRVSDYARAIAGKFDLSEDEVEIIATAALLHDLGKVGMADGILFGAKLLSPEERKSAERHAEIGATLLSKFPLFQKGTLLVRHHHERFDGKGYPDGLKGEAIPVGARIISVCDAYQAMTERRPYRAALSQETAIEQIRLGSGSQFDPAVVQAFIGILTPEAAKEIATPAANPSIAE